MPFDYERFRERLFPALLAGDRRQARLVAANAREQGAKAEELVTQGYFPLLKELAALYRSDRVSMLAHHYATRILHNLLESSQLEFSVQEPNQRRILIFSGSASLEELQGLIAADILEAAGWDVRFGGGGIAADEVLEECGRQRPDVLLIFGANQQDAPNVRSIIDTVNTVGAHPNMKIVVGGGVFSRTQELTGVSLGEQIGAHAEINNPEDLVEGLEVFYGEEVAEKVA